tara:strand:- start:183 stop:371 length:189 start_codon:yes stop_codon:yes gene_type:complete
MTDHEIMEAHFDAVALRWTIEDQVRYGSPTNERVTLLMHPEHLSKHYTRYEWMQMSAPLSSP